MSAETMEEAGEKCSCSEHLTDLRLQVTALEQASETLQRKLDGKVKDNENLVIKYAFVEKKVLDLRATVDDRDAKVRRAEQEIGALQKQLGTLKADKARLQKNIESKHRDIESLGREVEGCRHYSSQMEMRYQHSICRLRREADERTRLEAEVLTLRGQLLQHVIAEETHQANEQVAEMERKVMELQAREIMLKHANDEQAARVATVQKANADLRDALDQAEKKHAAAVQELKECDADRKRLRQQMAELQEGFEGQASTIAQLEQKLEDAARVAEESVRMERTIADQRGELERLAGTVEENRKDLEVLAARELELLALNKDLSEVNCRLQQEIATQEAKATAVTLEYDKFVAMRQKYVAHIMSLGNSLALERQHRTEERLLMAKHIADRTRKLERTENCLTQAMIAQEANQKKYYALVRDYKRELKNTRNGEEASVAQQPL